MRRILKAWGWAGLVGGCVASLATLRANPTIHGWRDSIVLTALLCAVYVAAFLLGGVAVAVVARLTGRRFAPGSHVSSSGEIAGVVAGLLVLGTGMLAVQTLDDHRVKAVLLVVFTLALLVAVMVRARMPSVPLSEAALRRAAAVIALAPFTVIVLTIAFASRSLPGEPVTTRYRTARLFLIGLDGLDWRKVDALGAQGRLPNLTALVRRGTRARLATTRPVWSPILWTTIATGVSEDKHGIYDFTEAKVPGLRRGVQRLRKEPTMLPQLVGVRQLVHRLFRLHVLSQVPITSSQRRAKAVWNLLSDQGRRVAVINWFASWPSERVEGYVVSDQNPSHAAFMLTDKKTFGAASLGMAGVTYPDSLLRRLSALPLPEIQRMAAEILRGPFFADLTDEQRSSLVGDPIVEVFGHIHAGDVFSAMAARHLLDSPETIDFLALYLPGIDNVSHRFGTRPGVVDHYYEFTDRLLGEIVARAGEDTSIVVVSDHGWEYSQQSYGHAHAPDGVLVMAGPAFRSGIDMDARPSIRDVAPTILQVFGVPIASDLDGAPLLTALTPDLAQVRTVRAYLPHVPPTAVGGFGRGAEAALQDETLERLRALGYAK